MRLLFWGIPNMTNLSRLPQVDQVNETDMVLQFVQSGDMDQVDARDYSFSRA